MFLWDKETARGRQRKQATGGIASWIFSRRRRTHSDPDSPGGGNQGFAVVNLFEGTTTIRLRIKRGAFPVPTTDRNVSNCTVFFALARGISMEQVNSESE